MKEEIALRIAAPRWLAYAAAGLATTLTGAKQVEAEIHYSGPVNFDFDPAVEGNASFPLDQPGDFISFHHDPGSSFDAWSAEFRIVALGTAAFRRHLPVSIYHYHYVAKLPRGASVAGGFLYL